MKREATLFNNSYFDIQEVLFRFMRAFDTKEWDSINDCLAETISYDYSSFRGEKPGRMLRTEYIAKRKADLANLLTQHNLCNLSFNCSKETAEVTCNYTIYRFHPEFMGAKEHYFHSYGQYLFTLERDGSHWKISAITQKLLINDGNPELHGATRRK